MSANSAGWPLDWWRLKKRKKRPRCFGSRAVRPKKSVWCGQNTLGKKSATLFSSPNPRREIADRWAGGSGGSNRMPPSSGVRLSTPSGTVTMTASALCTCSGRSGVREAGEASSRRSSCSRRVPFCTSSIVTTRMSSPALPAEPSSRLSIATTGEW